MEQLQVFLAGLLDKLKISNPIAYVFVISALSAAATFIETTYDTPLAIFLFTVLAGVLGTRTKRYMDTSEVSIKSLDFDD